jgi:hypothetical protein
LAKPEVRALVAEHEKAAAKRLAVTKERIIAELEGALELAKQKGDPAAMIRGWAEIAKLIGAYGSGAAQGRAQRRRRGDAGKVRGNV